MGLLKRIGRWLDDRTGLGRVITAAATHPVPPQVDSLKHGWWYIFGFATLTAFIIQAVTGMALATKYVPAPAHAYDALQYITNDVLFGRTVRGMHYFGASAMVLFMFIHLARVFLTGSFKFPREMNWLTGSVLMVLTLGLAFTGQLLRWDENGVWSVVVAANFVGRVPLIGGWLVDLLLAGDTVGGTTLTRFYALHVFFLPALLVAVLGVHLYLVLRNGISEPPQAGRPVDPQTYRQEHERLIKQHGPPYFPDGAWRELAGGLTVIAAVLLLAVVFGPRELSGPPDPTIVQADPRPDWYFRWYYALITVVPRFWTDVLLVYMPLAALIALILVPLVANRGERSPARRPWAVGAVALAFIFWGGLTIVGLRAPWVPDFETQPLTADEIGVTSGPVYAGALLFYAKGCQYCHGVAGTGGEYGPDLTDVIFRFSPAQLTHIILVGRGNMPSYRDSITAEELDAILAFLESIGRR